MRCPGCGYDTTPALPRCTRCNALLNAPGGHESAPYQAPSPYQPPSSYQPVSPYPPPMPPPSDEESTRLAPEPWSEPAIWQPPAPPRKSKTPYVLAAAGTVALLLLAIGIVFWPKGGSDPSADPAHGGAGGGAASAPQTRSETPSGDLDKQAGAVDALLTEMATTRTELGTVVVGGCETDALTRVLDARRAQLEKARALDVSAITGGTEMRDALVRALEASSESNQRYVDVSPGCPSDSEVADVNQRASDAKDEFIGLWNPVAQRAGLQVRTADDI
ncbi:hypothetical protein GCM10022254_40690 [Actinomadura meridiana]|uniref:Uncharacterized protein n=1 Tax=Actinomadura meridiana TaxID=559626 RepID=A0ABP8C734_9ACTN